MGVGIKGTLEDIDPLNKVPFKRARSRVQKGYPLRRLPNNTTYQKGLPRGSIYTTIMDLGPKSHSGDGLLGSDSILVVYLDPLG